MAKLDFILFCSEAKQDPVGGWWNVLGVMTNYTRLEVPDGTEALFAFDCFFRISEAEPLSEMLLRVNIFNSDGELMTDPNAPFKRTPVNSGGFAFGRIGLKEVTYDRVGYLFVLETPEVGEFGREWFRVKPLFGSA